VLEGEAYESAAVAIERASLDPLPDDLQRQLHGASVLPWTNSPFRDQVRQVLEHQIPPLRCAALERDAQALIDAETLGEGDASLDVARAHLEAAPQESVEACLRDRPRNLQITRDALERPRQGLTLDLPSAASPPALVR
jgi:hypothetical protein